MLALEYASEKGSFLGFGEEQSVPISDDETVDDHLRLYQKSPCVAPGITETDQHVTILVGYLIQGQEILKSADTLLPLESIGQLNGAFVIFRFHKVTRQLQVISSRRGSHQMFYRGYDQKHHIFSDKLVALVGQRPAEALDATAIRQLVCFGFIIDKTKTIFRGIRRLFSAECLQLSSIGEIESLTYRSPEKDIEVITDQRQFQSELAAAWPEIIDNHLQLVGDKQIVIPISAGLDSRMILLELIRQVERERIVTYCYGAQGSFEVAVAKDLCKRIGLKPRVEAFSEKFSCYEQVVRKCDHGGLDAFGGAIHCPHSSLELFKTIRNFTGAAFLVMF